MNRVSKRILASAVLLLGWVVLIGMQWSGEQSVFTAFVALPVAMVLMGALAALTQCDNN